MIASRIAQAAGWSSRLLARAQSLARARAEQLDRERRGDPARWRRANLLWPLFTKD